MFDLDRLLTAWAKGAVHADLSLMEPQIWARINADQRAPVSEILGFRAALIASVLTLGIVAGGAASVMAKPETSPFAVRAAYAPSTLLEGAP